MYIALDRPLKLKLANKKGEREIPNCLWLHRVIYLTWLKIVGIQCV